MEGVLDSDSEVETPVSPEIANAVLEGVEQNGAVASSGNGAVDHVPEPLTHHLSALIINKRRYIHSDVTRYRVYSSPEDSTIVEANSAHEAFEKSGIDKPYRIEKEAMNNRIALPKDDVEPVDESVSIDPSLPEPGGVGMLFIDHLIQNDSTDEGRNAFEPMAIGDLGQIPQEEKQESIEAETATLQTEEVSNESVDEPVDMPVEKTEPETPASGDDALTPEEVDQLLNGES